jgi:hypothetical protein
MSEDTLHHVIRWSVKFSRQAALCGGVSLACGADASHRGAGETAQGD